MREIRAKRESFGWSQQELSQKSGVPQTTISAIERGEISPSLKIVLRLAKALECSVEDLLEHDGPSKTA